MNRVTITEIYAAHAHPELLYDVHRTAATVADKLRSFGCDEVVTGIGRTGVVGVIRGRKSASGKTIGLRADMIGVNEVVNGARPAKEAMTGAAERANAAIRG